MSTETESQQAWEKLIGSVGFREAALGRLRARLRQEIRKDRVDGLIRRLSKYHTQVEIVELLQQNPAWRGHLAQVMDTVPEVTAEPEIHFVFQAEGNVPSVPLVRENRLYFGSGASFYALEAESGTVLWRRRRPGKTWSPAWLSEDCLYVCAPGELLALSPADGSERWRFQVKKRLTAPFAHQGKVFAGSEEGTLYALDAETGRRLWTFNVAQAVVVAAGAWEKRIFAASQDRSLYAIDIEEGECLWRFTTGGRIHAAPCLAHDVVYLGSADHKVYALQAARGRLLWSFATGGEVRTTPSEDHGLVFIGSRDRHLYVLSAIDGKELWRRQFFGYPSAAAARRGMVYLSAQGRVYGFSAADQKMRWFFPSGHSLATAPAVTPNRIYLGTLGGKLLCLKWQTLLPEQGATHLIRKFLAPDLEAPS